MESADTANPRFAVEEFGHRDYSIHDTKSQLNYGAFFTRKAAQDAADRRNAQQAVGRSTEK